MTTSARALPAGNRGPPPEPRSTLPARPEPPERDRAVAPTDAHHHPRHGQPRQAGPAGFGAVGGDYQQMDRAHLLSVPRDYGLDSQAACTAPTRRAQAIATRQSGPRERRDSHSRTERTGAPMAGSCPADPRERAPAAI